MIYNYFGKVGLRRKFVIAVMAFSVFTTVFLGAIVAYSYYERTIESNRAIVYGYLKSASDYIDGDKIQHYLDTGETDEYYDNITHYLDSTRKATDIKLFAVFVPYEDDLVYVWMSDEGQVSSDWLNKHEEYMEGGKETRDQVFSKNPQESISTYNYRGETILAGFYPIYNSEGEPVALIDVDMSFPSVIYNIYIFVASIITCMAVCTLFNGILFYKRISHYIIKPIRTLNNETKELVKNIQSDEFEITKIKTGDELEELSDSFYQMNQDIRHYIKENIEMSAEKQRVGADLELASKIQRDLLPNINDISRVKGFDLYAIMDPAREVGGDFFDFFMINNTKLAFLIADVSDKGAAAALFMAITKTLIRSRAGMGGEAADIIDYVDVMIEDTNAEGMFVTVYFAIIDLVTGHMDICNAGHDYPAVLQKGNGDEDKFVIEKTPHGPPIGFIPGAQFVSYELDLEPGDRIFLYTDGVTESKRPDGDRFGTNRLLDVLNENKDNSCKDIIMAVKSAVDDFAGEEPQFDDMTMLSFTYEGLFRK